MLHSLFHFPFLLVSVFLSFFLKFDSLFHIYKRKKTNQAFNKELKQEKKKHLKAKPSMVFSSVPLYLDPYNWQQQQSHQQQLGGGGGHGSSIQNPQFPPSSAPAGAPVGSIRMADRARLAKVPMPEPGLKCPRCESTNTKFCYFNNYSLSQPRHFCKTCRRYWTRGGALRNVPVGGGCRRNKRSSSKNNSASSSKSPAAINNNDIIIVPTGHLQDEAAPISSSNSTGIGFPLLASLQGLTSQSNLGLNFSGGIIQPPQIGTPNDHNQSSVLGFHVGSSSSTCNYPNFLAGFEPPPPTSSLYTFHNDGDDHHHQNAEAPPLPSSSIFGGTHYHQLVIRSHEDQSQNAPPDIKGEEAMSRGFNLVSSSRPRMGGVSENNHQFWDGNSNNAAWPDFSGINNSSSTSTRNNM